MHTYRYLDRYLAALYRTHTPIHAYIHVHALQVPRSAVLDPKPSRQGAEPELIRQNNSICIHTYIHTCRYLVVLYWIQSLLDKALRENLLDNRNSEAHAYMQSDLLSIRDSTSDVFAHLYCKIPYIYMQLLTCMVKIYLIVVAVIAGSSMRAAVTWIERILPVFLVLVANFAYEGILQVCVCCVCMCVCIYIYILWRI
jgi:hypothetical protein